MAFTYDLTSTDEDELNISKVRLELGDTVLGVGVRPDNSNLTDAEIAIWLGDEDDHVMRTVARACEALARMWTNVSNITTGPRKEELGKVAGDWSKRAESLRTQYGGTSGSAFSASLTRTDGYSVAASEADYGA